MVDTVRTDDEMLALLPDNTTEQIEPKDMRDLFVTLRDRDKFKIGYKEPSGGAVALDLGRANHWKVKLTASVTSLTFTNVPLVNLAWPSNKSVDARIVSDVAVRSNNAGTDPNGGTDAARLAMPAGGLSAWALPIQVVNGVTYNFGVYTKENGVGSLFNIGLSTASNVAPTLGAVNAAPTSGWTLASSSWVSNATGERWFMIDNRSNSVAFDMLIWGIQVIAGAALPSTPLISDTVGPAGESSFVRAEFIQDATGSRTVNHPANVYFEAGVDPTLSTAAGAIDIIDYYSSDGGASWMGVHVVKGAA